MADNFNSQLFLLKLFEPVRSRQEQLYSLRLLDVEEWEALAAEAEKQGAAPLLYPLLVELEKTWSVDFPSKENLHANYLTTAIRNTFIMEDTKKLLLALHDAGIAAGGLKGVYLLENVYVDIGARSMNDIDILVKKADVAASIKVLEDLGYKLTTYFSLSDQNIDTKHVPPMRKAGGPLLEVHWTLLEENEPFSIDMEELWKRIMPVRIANVDAFSLGIEDLLLHLCLHLTYQHYLQLGLRGLLDIALVIHKFQQEIDWTKLVQIAKSWRAERVTALTLMLVETQLKVPIPAEIYSSLLPVGIDPKMLSDARSQLLDQQRFEDRLTPDLVEMNRSKRLFKKVKIGFQRVFIPRLALARIYNVPPNSPKIFGLYWVRLKYLIRNYGGTLGRLQSGETTAALQKAEISYSLHEWMTK